MNQQLNEIKEALSKATPGPWTIMDGRIFGKSNTAIDPLIHEFAPDAPREARNAHLIANAPQWLASLVSQVEEMQKTLVEIANMRPSICTWSDEEYYENFSKCEEIAQQTIQSLKGDKP
jgi:hypothetical protein